MVDYKNKKTGEQGMDENRADAGAEDDKYKLITKTIKAIKYGTVSVVVHEGRVVQIEKSEKTRFT